MTNSPPLHILLLAESEPKAALDRRALREAGADRVECRTSGVEAARLLARIVPPLPDFFPQAVVCSQRLADMDGEQFCAMLRLHPLLLDLPVLLILPSDSEAEQLRTLYCGASACWPAPIPYACSNSTDRADRGPHRPRRTRTGQKTDRHPRL